MAMLRQVTDAEHESACKRLKAERSGGQGLADGGGDAAAAMRRIGKWFALWVSCKRLKAEHESACKRLKAERSGDLRAR